MTATKLNWCSWLSRQSNTLKVAGSSPAFSTVVRFCFYHFSHLSGFFRLVYGWMKRGRRPVWPASRGFESGIRYVDLRFLSCLFCPMLFEHREGKSQKDLKSLHIEFSIIFARCFVRSRRDECGGLTTVARSVLLHQRDVDCRGKALSLLGSIFSRYGSAFQKLNIHIDNTFEKG